MTKAKIKGKEEKFDAKNCNDVNKLREVIFSQEKVIATLKKSNAGLKGINGILNGKLTDAVNKVKAFSDIIDGLRVDNDKQKADLALKNALVDELRKQKSEMENTIESLKEKNEEIENTPWYKRIFK